MLRVLVFSSAPAPGWPGLLVAAAVQELPEDAWYYAEPARVSRVTTMLNVCLSFS